MKYFIVSDVHGHFTQMRVALDKAGYDVDDKNATFVSLGDLFDRGTENKLCLDFVLSIPEERRILIRGNHEDLLEKLMARKYVASHDVHNGAVRTIVELSTCIDFSDEGEIIRGLYKNKDLMTYLDACIPVWETKTAIFTHGWIPCTVLQQPGSPTDQYIYNKNWRDVGDNEFYQSRWICGAEAWRQGVREPEKTIYCGHWHTSFAHSVIHGNGSEFGDDAIFTPFEDDGICAIDACVPHSGFVNCVVLEED